MDRFTIKQLDGIYHVYDLGVIQEINCCDENNKNWFSLYEGAAIDKLGQYEDTGLTPQEIEQMKARMPLHQWAGESPDKMSIFGVTVSKIMELAKAEKEGRLAILTVQDIHPCRNCNTGWGSISSEGCNSCEETCIRLKEYSEKYSR